MSFWKIGLGGPKVAGFTAKCKGALIYQKSDYYLIVLSDLKPSNSVYPQPPVKDYICESVCML